MFVPVTRLSGILTTFNAVKGIMLIEGPLSTNAYLMGIPSRGIYGNVSHLPLDPR